ncbi:MAG: HAD family hydrolase, partial [Nitrososphaerales archaeon]
MMLYRKITDKISIREESASLFRNVECAILDCDGTLVNINRSYNACIKKTVGLMLERILGGREEEWYSRLVTDEIILRFRMSGGFNNDTDTSYACTVAALASGSSDLDKAREFVLEAASHAGDEGIVSVERYLSGTGHADAVRRAKQALGYPGPVGSSMLTTVFDELFYGRELFAKLHGIRSEINSPRGFIEDDEAVITREVASELSKFFNGKIAIVSGRGRLATEYSLKMILLEHFDVGASVFLEDELKAAMKGNSPERIGKPEPYALLKAMGAMNASSAISLGDSAEDIIMSRRAGEKKDHRVLFCG